MNILCYGDSNTYGLTPDWKGRYPRNIRWTGRLQAILGPEHYVIEDGLVGRTCACPDEHRYGRSALDFLPVALECHHPLDFLVLAMGTNDCKMVKARTVEDAAVGMEQLVILSKRMLAPQAKLLIVTSAPLRPPVLQADPDFDQLSIELSRQLAAAHRKIAEHYDCLHLDAGSVTQTGDVDGEHLDETGHAQLAEAIAKIILENKIERNDLS